MMDWMGVGAERQRGIRNGTQILSPSQGEGEGDINSDGKDCNGAGWMRSGVGFWACSFGVSC